MLLLLSDDAPEAPAFLEDVFKRVGVDGSTKTCGTKLPVVAAGHARARDGLSSVSGPRQAETI